MDKGRSSVIDLKYRVAPRSEAYARRIALRAE